VLESLMVMSYSRVKTMGPAARSGRRHVDRSIQTCRDCTKDILLWLSGPQKDGLSDH
jgi:hypothetical protein